jgi:hypothetical protein
MRQLNLRFPYSSQVVRRWSAAFLYQLVATASFSGDPFPSVLESDYLQPLWAKSPARGWVQDCLWKTFREVFVTMPVAAISSSPMVLSEF